MLKHRDIDSFGSFLAQGIGFEYEYNATQTTLAIADAKRERSLLNIDLSPRLLRNPLDYVITLDKVCQIQALMVSNKRSIDLPEIYNGARLVALLENSIAIANYACDLKEEDFKKFEENFCQEFSLKKMQLEKFAESHGADSFYAGEIKTRNNNSVRTTSSELYQTIKELSERTIRDLATVEYTQRFQQSAQNLLSVSSNLAVISKTLNERYIPIHKIIGAKTYSKNMSNINF